MTKILIAVLMLTLAGCSSTINFVSVEADNGSMVLGADVSTPITQDASGEGAFATQGAAAALGTMSDLIGKYIPDLSQRTENITTPPAKPAEPANPVVPPVAPSVPGEIDDGTGAVSPEETKPSDDLLYQQSSTYTSYGVRNQGRQAWRIPRSGKDLGSGPIKFAFSSGKTFIVKNPLKNCRDQENCSRNSKAAMYGFVYKPGIGPNGEGDDNTGTDHGGIYLHAPFGDSSKTVTMYW